MRSAAPQRVLLVDLPDQMEMYAIELRRRGYDVLMASDCDNAIAVAHAQRPNVIVISMRLRGISGWETCRRLKAGELTGRIPIILFTASPFDVTEEAAREVGAAELLLKPCLPEELAAAVEKYAAHGVRGTGHSSAGSGETKT